jgi:glycosyltransferase involved in cell wall biosynthesis
MIAGRHQADAKITVAVPSFNQGRYLDQTLNSLREQGSWLEVFVLDGGSQDNSLEVIQRHASWLAGWRSEPDDGQAAAINEGIAAGTAPFVCWLNSDDWLLPAGLSRLLTRLESLPGTPMAYGRAWHYDQISGSRQPVWVEPFNERRMAVRCIVCQPATLIRRSAWEAVGGLDTGLHMALDYDLWWRLYRSQGPLSFVDDYVAVNRQHDQTKTRRFRQRHYLEAISVVRRHYGSVPLKWWLAQPYAVWLRSLLR